MNIASSLNGTAIKYRKDIMMMPFLVLEEEMQGVITVRENISNEEMLPSFDSDAEMIPHTGALNYQTNVTSLGGRKISVYVGDVVFKENAEALRNTFMSDEIDNQSAEHALNMQIIGSVQGSVGENLAKNLFLAVRNPSGNTNADLFNGFDTIASVEKTANKISIANNNYVNLGNITAANALDKVKEFYAGWTPNLAKTKGVIVHIDDVFKKLINENIQADQPFGFASLSFDEILQKIVGWRKDVRVVTHFGKKGSGWIQATTPKIMVAGTNKKADLTAMRVREVENPWETQFVQKGCFGAEYANLSGKVICFGEVSLPS